jgi:hypothetical protein
MSLVVADESMQIEPYPYKTPQDKRKIFRINGKEQMALFDVYHKAFDIYVYQSNCSACRIQSRLQQYCIQSTGYLSRFETMLDTFTG